MTVSWSDNGVVLSARRYGEAGYIVSLMTEAHGRHAGLVPGALAPDAVAEPGVFETPDRDRFARGLLGGDFPFRGGAGNRHVQGK